MSEQPKKEPNSNQKSDPPKKPEPRTAGAPTTREDVFNVLPEYPDDTTPGEGNGDPDDDKITFKEALKEKVGKAKRMSMDFLGMNREDDKKDDKKDGGSKA